MKFFQKFFLGKKLKNSLEFGIFEGQKFCEKKCCERHLGSLCVVQVLARIATTSGGAQQIRKRQARTTSMTEGKNARTRRLRENKTNTTVVSIHK